MYKKGTSSGPVLYSGLDKGDMSSSRSPHYCPLLRTNDRQHRCVGLMFLYSLWQWKVQIAKAFSGGGAPDWLDLGLGKQITQHQC